MLCEICQDWARTGIQPYVPNQRGRDNMPLMTNHHEACPHFCDSLIDVWKVTYDGQSYYQKTEPQADELEGSETVTKEKMHSEIFDQLPEFLGF